MTDSYPFLVVAIGDFNDNHQAGATTIHKISETNSSFHVN